MVLTPKTKKPDTEQVLESLVTLEVSKAYSQIPKRKTLPMKKQLKQ